MVNIPTIHEDVTININEEKKIIPKERNILKTVIKNVSYTPISTPNSISNKDESPSIQKYIINSNPNAWTPEIEDILIDFSEICGKLAIICRKYSRRHKHIATLLQLLIIVGALTSTLSISSTKEGENFFILNIICGFFTILLSSLQGYFDYSRCSEIEYRSSLELERMRVNIRTELAKHSQYRVDPCRYIIELETVKDKILKRINIVELEIYDNK